MVDNLADDFAVLDIGFELLGKRAFFGILVGSLLRRKHEIYSGAATGEYLCAQALLAQVHSGTIHLIKQECGDHTVDLEGELGRLDDIETADQRVHNDRQAVAVVDGDSIGLVIDLDNCFVTPGDEDGVVLLGRDLDDFVRTVEILNEPLVALKILARRLATTHALRLGLLIWNWGPGTRHAVLRSRPFSWNCRVGTELRVLVCHLRPVNLTKARRDRISLVQLVKDRRHIWGC